MNDCTYDTDKIVDYFIDVHKDIDIHFEELITLVSNMNVPDDVLSKYRSKMHDLKEMMANFGKTFWINKKEAKIYRDKISENFNYDFKIKEANNGFLITKPT